jgi:hypothetical protein
MLRSSEIKKLAHQMRAIAAGMDAGLVSLNCHEA